MNKREKEPDLITFFSSAPLCSGRYAELQSEFASAVQTSVEQKALILKLEHDLGTIQALSSLPRPDAEGSEVGAMENIPEPIKEATAMFAGVKPDQRTPQHNILCRVCVGFFNLKVDARVCSWQVTARSSRRVRWTRCSQSSPANGRDSALATRSWKW